MLRWGWPLLGLLSVVVAWSLLTRLLGPSTFPGPVDTLHFLNEQVRKAAFWGHIGITLWRVLVCFALALALGLPLGWLLGLSPVFSAFAGPWLAIGLTLPRILILLSAFLIVGLNEKALVTAITLILLPTVAVQVREAVRSLDPRLSDMARAFRLSRTKTWRWVILPQLWPTLLGLARVTLSLSWKMVVFGEVFGRTSGVGYMISFYFQQFEMRGILAYGVVMTLILSALDGGLAWLSRRGSTWQQPPGGEP